MSAKRQSVEGKKAVLFDGLRQVRGEILTVARQFQPGEETVPFVGVWSLLDLLAHLAGWDVTNQLAAQEIVAGKIPSFYAHHSKDWAEYNALLVGEYRKDNMSEMLATVERTQQELISYLEALPSKDLFTDHGVRVGSYRVIISRLLDAERKDETRHLQQLVGFLAQRRT